MSATVEHAAGFVAWVEREDERHLNPIAKDSEGDGLGQ
jgi:hypothetical protein